MSSNVIEAGAIKARPIKASSIKSSAIELRGPFDLREVALMGFGHRDERSFDGVMRLAFCLDGDYETQVGVELRQRDRRLDLTIISSGQVSTERVTAQVARVVSADHDGSEYARICENDPVLEPVWSLAPGFRPALFYSPYEAAVWSILSARRGREQAIRTRARLAAEHGATFELGGVATPALPTPSQLLGVENIPGLPADRICRLHAVAHAAQQGLLAVERLQAMDPGEAMQDLQRLPGIGPFYSSLVVVRALGLADVLTDEPRARESLHRLYGRSLSQAEFVELAESWRPFRTWVIVMVRARGGRIGAGVNT